MTKEKIYPSLSDSFAVAWKSSRFLWPLFLVQLVFLILKYSVLWVLILLLVGPFVEKNWPQISEGIKNPQGYDWDSVENAFVNYFTDTNWILIALGAALLYTLWWSFLSAFADGGIYRAFWRNLEKNESFSFKEFFKNGMSHLFQMLFYQTLLFALSLLFSIGFIILILLGATLAGLLYSHSAALSVLLLLAIGIPTGIASLLFMFAFGAYIFLWKAEITREKNAGTGMMEAFKVAWVSLWESAKNFRGNRWRIGIGLILVFLIYLAISFVLSFFFGIFGSLPFIGLFFNLLDMLVSPALVVLFMTYMPALSVTYLWDEAKA